MMMSRQRTMTTPRGAYTFFQVFPLFVVLTTKGEKTIIFINFHHFSFQCVMGLSSMCGGCIGQEPFEYDLQNFNGLDIYFMDIMLIVLSIYVWMIFMLIFMYYEMIFMVVLC
jgi:hypothetical protein